MSMAVDRRDPAVVRRALMEVVACDGNLKQAAEDLKEAGVLDIQPATLRSWRDEFSEVYMDLEKQADKIKEDELKDMLLSRAHRAAEIEGEMLEKMTEVTNPRDLPQALRAVADTKTKSIDSLMKLTGRTPEGTGALSAEALMRSLAQSGLLKINVELTEPSSPSPDG